MKSLQAPSWVDAQMFPFRSNQCDTPAGRMHYLDEGQGSPVVFVHGNPTWSFTWRHLILGLRDRHRCIAPDHLGFGLSDKPDLTLRPQDHTRHLGLLLDRLEPRKVTLVVEDWGGPIALAWALENADRVERLVILNSWCWSVTGDPHFEQFSRFMGGPLGGWLIRHLNAFPRFVLPKAMAQPLPKAIHQHYLAPFPTAATRQACAAFPAQITGESEWLASLAQRLDTLAQRPVQLLWGMRDIAFRTQELERWQRSFPNSHTHTFADVGHCPQESVPAKILPLIADFIAQT